MKNIIDYKSKHENAGVYRVCARLTTPSADSKRKAISNVVRHAEISEKSIERYLVESAGLIGLPCLKYSNPNMTGYPDRLLVLRDGSVIWIELKSKGRKPTKLQMTRIAELRALGHRVEVIDNKSDIDELIKTAEQ